MAAVIVSIINLKGGVGKSTDISQFITQPPLVVSNVARSAATNFPGVLHMVVSTPSVAQLDEILLNLWENKKPMPVSLRLSLAEALHSARESYDYVLIDCPPGLSVFSSTALVASDYYISPIIPEPLSLQGVELVGLRVRELNQRYGARAQFKGVVLNIVKHFRTTHQKTANMLYTSERGHYQPFQYWLPDNERLRKLGEFDPDLPGTWGVGWARNSSH